MKVRCLPRLAVVLAVGGALLGCAADGEDVQAGVGAGCPDPAAAAQGIADLLPVYDYQGRASPSQLAESVDAIVIGDLLDSGTTAESTWIDLGAVTMVSGDERPAEMRVAVEQNLPRWAQGAPDRDELVGLRVLAFVHEPGDGRLPIAALEGLWLSCSDDGRAYPAKLEPVRDGWPLEPTIAEVAELVNDPPELVDGPVVRRSGVRPFEMTEPYQVYEPAGRRTLTGTVHLENGCLGVAAADGFVPVVWPPDASWNQDRQGVEFGTGPGADVGQNVTLTGIEVPALVVNHDVGTAAYAALAGCPSVATNNETPVVIVDDARSAIAEGSVVE